MASDEERIEILADAVHDDAEDNPAADIPQLPPAERSKTFSFTSGGEFLLLRWLLRGLSLWHPRSSSCFGRYFYPGLINFLLLTLTVTLTVGFIRIPKRKAFNINLRQSSKLYLVVLFASAYFSHLVGWVYFRSRDVENNIISITLDGRQLERFRKQIKYYNLRMVMSSAIGIFWLGFNLYSYILEQFLVEVNAYLNDEYVLPWLVLFGSVYVTGMYFAVLWITDLLHLFSNARLGKQHDKFLKWTQGAEAAINDHICNYTTKVETSCRRLRLWFLIHNISLTMLVPFVVLSNLVDGAKLHVGNVAFMAVYILIWAGPLYFAEEIEKNDEKFCFEVNNFCPERLITAMQNTVPQETAAVSLDSSQSEESYQHLTFVSRTEVHLLVAYLKNIGSGFVAVGYTFQLKLSIVAAVFSIGALIFKTHFGSMDAPAGFNMTFV